MKHPGAFFLTLAVLASAELFHPAAASSFLSLPRSALSASSKRYRNREVGGAAASKAATTTTSLSASSPTDEERAAALSDYLVKAHEDKLRAIQAVESEKGEEIRALKEQIARLKKGGGGGGMVASGASSGGSMVIATGGDLSGLSKEELINKVLQYQSFMSKYVVEAEEEKLRAVRNAEVALRTEFEQRLMALQLPGGTSAAVGVAGSVVSTTNAAATSPLYDARNAAVAAAAAEGKSRWGSAEARRAAAHAGSAGSSPAAAPAPAVKAAPAPAAGSVLSTAAATSSPLYDARNAAVAAAAAAGKSRWGAAEAQRAAAHVGSAVSSASPAPAVEAAASTSSLPPPPEVQAADHGLRADGGVGGWTLAERVSMGPNIGAAIVAAAQQPPKPPPTPPTPAGRDGGSALASTAPASSLYGQRNAHVLAAAAAGKTRWGPKEIEHISSSTPTLVASSANQQLDGAVAPPPPAASTAPALIPPEVEAANHGLRADGGVGGWTLAERVSMGPNIGASIVAATQQQNPPPKPPPTPPAPAKSGAGSALASSAPGTSMYQQRNAHVLATAAAGRSRWGPKEIERISSSAPTLVASSASQQLHGVQNGAMAPPAAVVAASAAVAAHIPPEVEAADHGLRSDGSVSLAERVALGSQVAGGSSPPSSIAVTGQEQPFPELYRTRNDAVLRAAAAGKSRWGPMEVERIQREGSSAPGAPSLAGSSTGGGSTGGRVNFGASLVGSG